jgi:hypothetical protein
MAKKGCEVELYDTCTDFYQAAIDQTMLEMKNNVSLTHLFGYNPDLNGLVKTMATSKLLHDHALDKRGQRSHVHRTHNLPFDEKLRKKKKFKKSAKKTDKKQTKILDRKSLEKYAKLQEQNSNMVEEVLNIVESQKDDLCRGKEIRPVQAKYINRKVACMVALNLAFLKDISKSSPILADLQ